MATAILGTAQPRTGQKPCVQATSSVPSVEKALLVLELIAGSRSGLSLTEITRLAGIAKSSAHCILLTLERHGYLHRSANSGRFLFSRKLLSLASATASSLRLREQAEPHLRELMWDTGLTVHLAILEADEAVLVGRVERVAGCRHVPSWIGKRMSAHCTAVGKALIAGWTEAQIKKLSDHRGLARHNDNTISSMARLLEDLAEVRRLGYAIDDEEDVLGIRCIGAPVVQPGGAVVASISVAGRATELAAYDLTGLSRRVRGTAATLSAALSNDLPADCVQPEGPIREVAGSRGTLGLVRGPVGCLH